MEFKEISGLLEKIELEGVGSGREFYHFNFENPVDVVIGNNPFKVINCTCKGCSLTLKHDCKFVKAVLLFRIIPKKFWRRLYHG